MDLYYFIAYFTSKKCKVRYADAVENSHWAVTQK